VTFSDEHAEKRRDYWVSKGLGKTHALVVVHSERKLQAAEVELEYLRNEVRVKRLAEDHVRRLGLPVDARYVSPLFSLLDAYAVLTSAPALKPSSGAPKTPVAGRRIARNILELLMVFPPNATLRAAEVQKRLDLASNATHTRLVRAKQLGLVVRIKQGHYQITEKGQMAPALYNEQCRRLEKEGKD
jgi:hypothetical protein